MRIQPLFEPPSLQLKKLQTKFPILVLECNDFHSGGDNIYRMKDLLAEAFRHVIEGRRIVLRQRQRVADLETKHLDAAEANRLLYLLLQSQRIFEENYVSVQKAMGLPHEVLPYSTGTNF